MQSVLAISLKPSTKRKARKIPGDDLVDIAERVDKEKKTGHRAGIPRDLKPAADAEGRGKAS